MPPSEREVDVIDLRTAPEPLLAQECGADADLGASPDDRAIRAAIDACIADYPGATRAHVEGTLRGFLAQTSGAKVQMYRVLLAERDTRVRLRRDLTRE